MEWPSAPNSPIPAISPQSSGVCGHTQASSAGGATASVATPLDQIWLVALSSTPAISRVSTK